MKRYQYVLEAAHVTELYGPVQALKNYLRPRCGRFIYITHPFHYSGLSHSSGVFFSRGKQSGALRCRSWKREVLSYFQQFLLTLFFSLIAVCKYGRPSVYVGVDNLNAFAGVILRKLNLVRTCVFYVIDYTPERFENRLVNTVYHRLDRICARHSDYVWSVSGRIAVFWKDCLPPERNLVVPIGIELEKIKKAGEKRRDVLVVVSHLTESKGVQLAIEAMDALVKEGQAAGITLEIIGIGPYESELRKMTARKNLEDRVRFLGKMEHETLMKFLPTCGVALATYLDQPGSITYYADPTKPKEYLACGLPVIITRVPWIAEEIHRKPMGVAINYDRRELLEAIKRLTTDGEFYDRCSENAVRYASVLDWEGIYDQSLEKSGGAVG